MVIFLLFNWPTISLEDRSDKLAVENAESGLVRDNTYHLAFFVSCGSYYYFFCVSSERLEEAYDKLLYDIKPKLTGLKTDENENLWGNGVFTNPWVNSLELQEILRVSCNEILMDIAILSNTLNSLENLEINTYSFILYSNEFIGYFINLIYALGLIMLIFLYLLRKKIPHMNLGFISILLKLM